MDDSEIYPVSVDKPASALSLPKKFDYATSDEHWCFFWAPVATLVNVNNITHLHIKDWSLHESINFPKAATETLRVKEHRALASKYL